MPTRHLIAGLMLALSAPATALDARLGEELRLEKGEIARLPGGATLRITGFIDSPCPKDARCVWSGQSVLWELKPKDAPFEVLVKKSDYRFWATFVVDDPGLACGRLELPQRGECLRGLARRRKAPGLCRSIADERTRGFCLEDLAEAPGNDGLCRGVKNPTQYCLYLRAKATTDASACERIVLTRWREKCVQELSP